MIESSLCESMNFLLGMFRSVVGLFCCCYGQGWVLKCEGSKGHLPYVYVQSIPNAGYTGSALLLNYSYCVTCL
jgi:hypothetical protein